MMHLPIAEQSTRVAFLEIDQSGFGFRGVSRATRTCGDPAFRGSSVHSECCDSGRVVGNSESAGINRHVVGDERALQERKVANPSWPRVLQAISRGIA